MVGGGSSILHSSVRRRIAMVHSSSRNPWDVIYLDFGQTAGNGLSSPTSKPDLIRKFRGATTQLLD